jgi:hypothetical protein
MIEPLGREVVAGHLQNHRRSGGGRLVLQRLQDRPADSLAAPLGDHGDVDQVQGVGAPIGGQPPDRRGVDRDDLEPGLGIGRAVALDLGVELLLHDLGQHVGGQGDLVPARAAGGAKQRQAEGASASTSGRRAKRTGAGPGLPPLGAMRQGLPVQVARSS